MPSASDAVSFRALRGPILAVFLVSLILRAAPLGHGLPGLYVPDTHSVRNALGILQTRNPVPRSNEFSSYPYLYSYLCIPLFVGDYAVARATGRAASSEEYQRDASAHLERFHYLARWIAAIAGALTAAAALLAGAALGGRKVGIATGWLAALSPMCFLLSTHERPWSLVLLFGSLAALGALRAMGPPAGAQDAMNAPTRAKALFWAGLAAGAAAGSHQTGLAMIALPIAAAWCRAPGLSSPALAGAARGVAASIAGFLPTFFLGNLYLLRSGQSGGPVSEGPLPTDASLGGQGIVFQFNAQYTVEALTGIFSMEGVVCVLAAAGAFLLLRRGERKSWVLLSLAVPIWVFFSAYKGTHARYYLLTFPALWPLAGAALASLAARGKMGIALAGAALAIPALLTLRVDQLLLREDTRNLAAAELSQRIPTGAAVALEPYGPPLRASAESLKRVAAAEEKAGLPILTRRERLALERAEAGGFDLLPLERVVGDAAPGGYTSLRKAAAILYAEAADLPSLLRAAQIRYVVSVDRFPGMPRTDPLAEYVRAHGTLRWQVEPQDSGAPPLEALLPFEPRRGVCSLFAVSRPGPRVALYELDK